jgi:adenylate kinase family enzyme
LKSGRAISSEQYVKIVKHLIEAGDGQPVLYSIIKGWIIDGFPRTVQDAEGLFNIGIIPDLVHSINSGKVIF